ncbi:MAG: nuclear transport factor 2 family protein, partial [Myxococcota bacterium]
YRSSWESYAAIWKLEGAEAKAKACRNILDEAVVYTDPLTQRKGWSELTTYMAEFHEQIPGGHFVTKEFWAHHGRSVARWNMVGGDGTVLGDGVSYAEYRKDGKLTSMTGFFAVDS